jgi:hypothetical protein
MVQNRAISVLANGIFTAFEEDYLDCPGLKRLPCPWGTFIRYCLGTFGSGDG